MKKKINIIGKVDKDNYKDFSNSDFIGYEIYLSSADDFKYLPDMIKRLNITSIHQPTSNFNLCDLGKKGKKSYETIHKLLTILNEENYNGIVVIHGNNYNELSGDKEKYHKKLAVRINKLANEFSGKPKISFENDIFFFNGIKNNKALLVFPEDFYNLEKYLKVPAYITLDFEHVWISAIFRSFCKKYPYYYESVSSIKDLKRKEIRLIELAWLKYINKNSNEIEKIVIDLLNSYIKLKSKIINFHINGSNLKDYWFDKKIFTPLAGEHLTVGEKGDALNYRIIKNYLEKLTLEEEIKLVIETLPRKNFRKFYKKELIKSGKNAKNKFIQ